MAEDRMTVTVSRVSTIAPAIPTSKDMMFLSAIDIRIRGIAFFFYKTPEKDFSTIVEKLKRSLSLVLVDFYPVAGRLVIKGAKSGRPELDCNDGGVEFVEASIDMMAFEDLERDDFQNKNFFMDLSPIRHGNEDESLLSIQVTDFQGGGICIASNFQHCIVDGNSGYHFLKGWEECSRELPISKNPHHMRTVLKRDYEKGVIPNIHIRVEEVITDVIDEAQIIRFVKDDSLPLKYSEINASAGDGSNEAETKSEISTLIHLQKSLNDETKPEISTFHFSERLIEDLKKRSGASTSFVAVAAQFWRCVMKARQVPENEPVSFILPADCRGRVKPPLPPTYFGNCVCSGIAQTTAKQLLEKDIVFAAALIQENIYSCASEVQFNNYVDSIESQLAASGSKDVPTLRNFISNYIVTVAMSPKLPVYEIDHGWGRPLNVQPPSVGNGWMAAFPVREGRSIALSTKLPHHQMEILKQIIMVIPD